MSSCLTHPDAARSVQTAAGTSTITRDDVAHLAALARIQPDDAVLDRLGHDLPKILDSVATVSRPRDGPAATTSPTTCPTSR
jgi:Asp-tRNA(Asn)/Glu-tRNA(Gln) amidotransferase C subunit